MKIIKLYLLAGVMFMALASGLLYLIHEYFYLLIVAGVLACVYKIMFKRPW